ncbi:hypothetical protein PMI14_07209, partial [Acidovorax sp. CF316]
MPLNRCARAVPLLPPPMRLGRAFRPAAVPVRSVLRQCLPIRRD